ncbi:MAG: cation-transporting P-type ATPase [Promethearchaeota archaeon]
MAEIKKISAHSIESDEVINALNSSRENGITEEEVLVRLEKYGKNELIKEKGKTAFQIFISQFKDFLIYLLYFAIAVSIIIGMYEGSKPGAESWSSEIATIIIVNAILGFYQEYQAEKSMESLKKMAPHFARVRRNGQVKEIAAEDLVPGDIILVEDGDKFPADIRLFKEFSLYADGGCS